MWIYSGKFQLFDFGVVSGIFRGKSQSLSPTLVNVLRMTREHVHVHAMYAALTHSLTHAHWHTPATLQHEFSPPSCGHSWLTEVAILVIFTARISSLFLAVGAPSVNCAGMIVCSIKCQELKWTWMWMDVCSYSCAFVWFVSLMWTCKCVEDDGSK